MVRLSHSSQHSDLSLVERVKVLLINFKSTEAEKLPAKMELEVFLNVIKFRDGMISHTVNGIVINVGNIWGEPRGDVDMSIILDIPKQMFGARISIVNVRLKKLLELGLVEVSLGIEGLLRQVHEIIILVVEDSPVTALSCNPDVGDWAAVVLIVEWVKIVILCIIGNIHFARSGWFLLIPPEFGVEALPDRQEAINLTARSVGPDAGTQNGTILRMMEPKNRVKCSDWNIAHMTNTSGKVGATNNVL
ncbi:hypothetical protein HG531_003821 [Fusarium graminearum]|nr:hypothetical protein HG531_003821 [Fusarium graminearum]